MSLRARLLAVVLALMVVALVAAGWATHVALESFLVNRVDRDLRDAPLGGGGSLDVRGPSRRAADRGAGSSRACPPARSWSCAGRTDR